MNIKHAQYMLTVMQEGSITAAAKKLYISQPSLSRFLTGLEKELGTPLFIRNNGILSPTPAGELFFQYIASLKGIRPMVAGKRVKDLLAQVGLTKSANKKMKKLSGGMKRRAGIVQAMLNNPKILILDEPTAGLDPTERVRFRNLISELSEDRIVILSTHIVSDVEYIANEIWLMKDGQIMQQGNLDQTLASMREKVYACEVSQEDATKMMKEFKVSNMKAESGMVNLRIIASEPPIAGASVVEPTLEDVFLYYFGEKGGEME